MPTLRFTKQSIAAIAMPPGKAEILIFDTEVKGFGIKLSAGGSQKFILQYRPAGQRQAKRLTIGPVGTLTVDEARRQAKAMLAKALTGQDPHATKVAAKAQAALTLGNTVDRYLQQCESRQRPGTFYQTKLHLTKHWAPLRHLPLHQIRRADVATRLTTLRNSSGGVSANRSRSQLSAMFAWAIGEGLTEVNPVIGTHKPEEEKPRERVLSAKELRAIWHACRDDAYGKIVRLLILTAQRRDEVGGIADAELDLLNALWTLPGARSKNKREHSIPLSPTALAILSETPRLVGSNRIFSVSARGFSAWSGSKRRIDERLNEAGTPLPLWTPHDLRRTAATMMADRLGVLPHVIEAILNHVSGHKAGVAGVYNRATYLTEKRAALSTWDAYVRELVGLPHETSSGETGCHKKSRKS